MNPDIEHAKALFLKLDAKRLQQEHPSWSFGRAWAASLEAHPEWQEVHASESEEPGAVYRYKDDAKPAPKVDLQAILQHYGPKRVEAKKPREEEGVERVEALEPVGANPILVRGIDVGMITRIGQ